MVGGSLGLVLGCFGLAQVVLGFGSNIYNLAQVYIVLAQVVVYLVEYFSKIQ